MRLTIESLEPRRLCAAGDQDFSFGENGILHLRFGETPYQFLPGSDPTGTAFVVSMNANGQSFDIRKFINGVPDTSAGRKGSIITIPLPFTAPAGSTTKVGRIWEQSGGRLVVEFTTRNRTILAGDLYPDGHYARLNADFTLDTSYGNNGWRDMPFRLSLVTAHQGDALVAIERNKVTRYTPEGVFDTTFGNGGAVLLNGLSEGAPGRIAVQSDGKILVAGTKVTTSLYRLNPNGTPDTTFGGGGGHIEVPDISDNFVGLAVDGAGNVIVSGDHGVARFSPTGVLDGSFGGATLVPTQDLVGTQLFVLRDGRIIAGRANAFVRLEADGIADDDFGIVATDFSSPEFLGADNYSRMLETIHPDADGSVQIWRREDDGRFTEVLIQGGGSEPGHISLSGGIASVTGTAGDDHIVFDFGERILLNGVGRAFAPGAVTGHRADAGDGHDLIDRGNRDNRPATLDGGAGNDVIYGPQTVGTAAPMTVMGGYGNDKILCFATTTYSLFGGLGNDTIRSGDGDDSLYGQGGHDFLYGGGGDDYLEGGNGNDHLYDGISGNDTLIAGRGTDSLFGGDVLVFSGDDMLFSSIA